MSENHWIWRCDHTIPSDTKAGRRILDQVIGELQARKWGPRDIFGVQLGLEEALVNAILHGNGLDADKQVHVVCRMTPDLVRIEITDEGEGFDPATIPDPTAPDRLEAPTGRGVMLMRSFMSRVEYNEVGNRVVMEKDRAEQQ